MEGADAVLESMLADHPRAWVGAINVTARYVPLPSGVPITGHRQLRGRWPLDLVAAVDRMKLAEAWRERDSRGVTVAHVKLVTGERATFHVFALAHELGADILVVVTDADLELAMDTPPEVMASRFCRIIRDEAGRALEIDDAAPMVLGHPAEDLLSGRPPLERIHPDDHAVMLENWIATLANQTDGHRCRIRIIRGDGSFAWFELTNFNRLDDPMRPHVISEMLDISEEMSAHEAVAAREQLLHRLATALPLGVLQLDPQRRVVYKNDYLDWILGTEHASTMTEQFVAVVDDDRPLLEKAFAVALHDGADDDVVIRLAGVQPSGDRIVRVITKSLRAQFGEVTGVIACVTDVTEATLMGRELERRATFDTLTGSLNRAAILADLASALSPESGGVGVAVVYLDLDGFKEVNDRYGHAAGDELLRAAARILTTAARPSDVVGRLGGDEFLVVCQDVADSALALDLAHRISEAVRREAGAAGLSATLRASVGVAWSATASVHPDQLVHRADEAMYMSKREGKGRAHLWFPGR